MLRWLVVSLAFLVFANPWRVADSRVVDVGELKWETKEFLAKILRLGFEARPTRMLKAMWVQNMFKKGSIQVDYFWRNEYDMKPKGNPREWLLGPASATKRSMRSVQLPNVKEVKLVKEPLSGVSRLHHYKASLTNNGANRTVASSRVRPQSVRIFGPFPEQLRSITTWISLRQSVILEEKPWLIQYENYRTVQETRFILKINFLLDCKHHRGVLGIIVDADDGIVIVAPYGYGKGKPMNLMIRQAKLETLFGNKQQLIWHSNDIPIMDAWFDGINVTGEYVLSQIRTATIGNTSHAIACSASATAATGSGKDRGGSGPMENTESPCKRRRFSIQQLLN